MDRFVRIVLGYHGCEPAFAERMLRGEIAIADWTPSANDYDWLGHGIYFWEHAPERARGWGEHGGVVGAIIQLGSCLDLTDIKYTELLAVKFATLRDAYALKGWILPQNGSQRRDLDCLIINSVVNDSKTEQDDIGFQTVRGPFLEGAPAFEGSGIYKESHIQISVRDVKCILGVFRPNFG